MNHVGRRLLPPIFILNIGHNQSASRIVALTFLTKNVSDESAFFRVPTAFTVSTAHIVPTASTAPTSPKASTPSGVSTPPVLITNEQSTSYSQGLVIRSVKVNIYMDSLIHE